jgi:hypothetical protein
MGFDTCLLAGQAKHSCCVVPPRLLLLASLAGWCCFEIGELLAGGSAWLVSFCCWKACRLLGCK